MKKTKPKPRPKPKYHFPKLPSVVGLAGLVASTACAGAPPDVKEVQAEAIRIACYAAAASSSERTLSDLCPVHGTEDEEREQMSRCEAGPEILHQLELKLEECDMFGI